MTDHEQQLELFQVGESSAPAPRRETIGSVGVRLRHDQMMLLAIGALIGVAVVFAGGVERGKQLVRGERRLLDQAPEQPAVVSAKSLTHPSDSAGRTVSLPIRNSEPVKITVSEPPARASARYAIQVATYSQSKLATQELQRLHAKGESAFLMKRGGRIIVYIGPFPSQGHASKKLVVWKNRYQDCFVKTL